MLRNFLKIKEQTTFRFILYCTLFFMLINAISLYKMSSVYFDDFSLLKALLWSVSLVVLTFSFTCLILSIFSFNKYFLKLWVSLLLVISSIAIFFINSYGVYINKVIVTSVFATSIGAEEVQEYISLSMGLYFIFLGVIPSCFVWMTPLKKIQYSRKSVINISLFYGSLVLFIIIFYGSMNISDFSRNFRRYDYSKTVPFSFTRGVYGCLRHLKKAEKEILKLTKIEDKFTFNTSGVSDDMVVVFVIGESARAQNFYINGYARDTNPYTKSIKNIVNYGVATSCATATVISVPCMFSRFGRKKFELYNGETTLISILKNNGFDTSWYSAQSYVNRHKMCRESNKCKLLLQILIDINSSNNSDAGFQSNDKDNPYDENLVVYLKKELRDKENSLKQNKLIMLHLNGSHSPYYRKYPKEFDLFKPSCNGLPHLCNYNNVVNDYDNSLVYTDYIISKMINELKNKNAILIYTSDHGESLGEKGVYAHCTPYEIAPKEQTEVPLYIWASDKYIEQNPEKYRAMKSYKKPASHDNIFHTLLGCAGIKSDIIDDDLNFCHDISND